MEHVVMHFAVNFMLKNIFLTVGRKKLTGVTKFRFCKVVIGITFNVNM